MNIEEKIEIEANKMLEKYYKYYFKKYPRRFSQVKEKFMPFFIKASQMFCIREGFKAEKFIDAFMMDGFKFPAQMCYEKVWETYLDYLPALKEEKTEDIEVVENIVNAATALKKNGGIKEWLKSAINQRAVKENKMPFGILLLSFSEAFINFCKKECNGVYNLDLARDYVLSQKSADKVLIKIKEFLGIDYYRFDKDLEEAHFIF